MAALQDRTRLAYVRYRGGVDTLLNALDADRDLFQAELTLSADPVERTGQRRATLQSSRRWLAVGSLRQARIRIEQELSGIAAILEFEHIDERAGESVE